MMCVRVSGKAIKVMPKKAKITTLEMNILLSVGISIVCNIV